MIELFGIHQQTDEKTHCQAIAGFDPATEIRWKMFTEGEGDCSVCNETIKVGFESPDTSDQQCPIHFSAMIGGTRYLFTKQGRLQIYVGGVDVTPN